ncbi:MAG: AraC family transcriptional regulator [Bacteroidales bacterium]|nr:AraC family transcriptional regulator [Bacteroidales bacterium]
MDPATETAWIWSFDPGHGVRQYLAGFSNEANFFRTFRQVTGKTPSEWKESKI